jgi:flagellum-specific ATP synthase
MKPLQIELLTSNLSRIESIRSVGRVMSVTPTGAQIEGLETVGLGDRIEIMDEAGVSHEAEILSLENGRARVISGGSLEGVAPGVRAINHGPMRIAPDESWIGRLIDANGRPLDGRPLLGGHELRGLRTPPPSAADRRSLGGRLETGLAAFNTVLPLARGQRMGLFAGSGVGKSTLLSALARGVEADVVVIALIGERGREVRHFVENVLGPKGMERAVVVAATSDQPALLRRRCAWTAMAVAEHFRDRGRQVLFLADSITRFAEAHREIALSVGESPSLKGHPPSLGYQIMSLAERAGPGPEGTADITAVFSILVAGSDMEEPVADILRGTLDGHVVLDRTIAERGRFPAIDLLRSVSRCLPSVASETENALIADTRSLLGAYAGAELMIQSGLYVAGSDPQIDRAIRCWPELDRFIAVTTPETVARSFERLRRALGLQDQP